MKAGIDLIAQERQRQFTEEGWDDNHDDAHVHGELAQAAAVYATVEQYNVLRVLESPERHGWPWDINWLKPFADRPGMFPTVDRVRCLVKAGALIAAEIDRLQRLEQYESP